MKLNTAQMEAVSIKEGPALVLAGPGSGKTAVITQRLAALLRSNVQGSRILVITFTRAAASEMRDRFRRMFPEFMDSGITFGTFHSVFYMMLKRELGLSGSNIAKDSDRKRIMSQVITDLGLQGESQSTFIQNLLDKISLIKSLGQEKVLETEAEKHGIQNLKDFDRIRTAYLREMAVRRLVDYDDMILMTYRLFNSRPQALMYWRSVFDYILVDEFQDVNQVQYNVLRQLMPPGPGKGANLFVVGDDDQSIYGFRGASSRIMLQFPEDYPDARRVLLDINYRCSGEITSAALRVISHNEIRYSKAISPQSPGGPGVVIKSFQSTFEENAYILAEIKTLHAQGLPYEEMAALYRTSRTYRGLLEMLKKNGIPYCAESVLPSIYNHWIGEDVFAYLRIFSGSRLRKDFLKIINKPSRFLKREAFETDVVNFRKLYNYYTGHPKIREIIYAFEAEIKFASKLSPFSAINFLRKSMCYDDYVKEFAHGHLIDPEELFSVLDELQEEALSCKTLEEWLAFAIAQRGRESQAMEEAEKKSGSQGGGGVRLSTLHGAKGLEYAAVFMPDSIEGLIPYKEARSHEEIEEERRLFYVGMTRAKRRLYVLFTTRRFGRATAVSRFVGEIGT